MTRTLTGLDRLVVLLFGLIFLALGVGAVLWRLGVVAQFPTALRAPWLTSAVAQSWWPWAVGAAGLVLVVLALRWLTAHLPGRGLHQVRLPGSSSSGRLTADLGALASTAADVIADTPGVRSASGKAVNERGRRTLRLTATVDATADLAVVTAATDRVCAQLGNALADPSVAARVHVRVARTASSERRVV